MYIAWLLSREPAYRTVAYQWTFASSRCCENVCLASLASNGLPFWLHYSGFQASCHNTLSKCCWSWSPLSGPMLSRGVSFATFYHSGETAWWSNRPSNGPYRIRLLCQEEEDDKETQSGARSLSTESKSAIHRNTKLSVVAIVSLLTRSRLLYYSWRPDGTISKSQLTTQSPEKNTEFQELLSIYQLLWLDKLTLWYVKVHRNDIIN
jgi:hypothetical protein